MKHVLVAFPNRFRWAFVTPASIYPRYHDVRRTCFTSGVDLTMPAEVNVLLFVPLHNHGVPRGQEFYFFAELHNHFVVFDRSRFGFAIFLVKLELNTAFFLNFTKRVAVPRV